MVSTPIDLDGMTTTKSFILTLRQVQWIREETARRKEAGGKANESVVVRDALDAAISTTRPIVTDTDLRVAS